MSKQLDRSRAKHQELVKLHAKQRQRYDDLADSMLRARARVLKTERAIARSQARLDKLVAAATHNRSTGASVLPTLVEAVDRKLVKDPSLDDLDALQALFP
jgi:uncharacterized circularly permuted ATP-grasp superfamily protein